MSKPITVRDRAGNNTVRYNGILMDGDQLVKAFGFMDSSASRTDVHSQAARILGDDWDAEDYAGLNDDALRHAIVKRKLGDAAARRSTAFLDSAWNTLAGVVSVPPVVAPPPAVMDAVEQFKVADRALMDSAKAEQHRVLSDGWKTPDHRARDAGYRADAAKNGGDERIAGLRDLDTTLRNGWRRGAC